MPHASTVIHTAAMHVLCDQHYHCVILQIDQPTIQCIPKSLLRITVQLRSHSAISSLQWVNCWGTYCVVLDPTLCSAYMLHVNFIWLLLYVLCQGEYTAFIILGRVHIREVTRKNFEEGHTYRGVHLHMHLYTHINILLWLS